MKIYYVCTNYNNTHFTINAVNSLFAQTPRFDTHAVVVDNNSCTEEGQALEEYCNEKENVDVILCKTNLGYFQGLNLGLSFVAMQNPDVVIIGNNDLEFPPGFLEQIHKNRTLFCKHPIVSPNIITIDGIHQNPHVIERISGARELLYDIYHLNYRLGTLLIKIANLTRSITKRGDEDLWREPRHIFQGHGSVFLASKLFFQEFELLWAPTFLMGEEYFLSTQLASKGYSIYYEPKIEVVHHWHAAVKDLPRAFKWKLSRAAHYLYKTYKPQHPSRLPHEKTRNK